MGKGIIEKYRLFLPVSDKTPIITLGEGETPLIKAENLSRFLELESALYLKVEGVNPTGSFKDRGMTMAISKAVEEGAKAIICASTGNTSASAAAYGARAGIPVIVVLPGGGVALGKLAQALMYGAKVIQIKGNFDAAFKVMNELANAMNAVVVNSTNPYRLEGQKTAAFEICEELDRCPTFHFIPVGNGGNITAYWRGYIEYGRGKNFEKLFKLPRMVGWQAEGAAPIVQARIVENPQTVASAIRIGNPAHWQDVVETVLESRGLIDTVSDEEILEAQKLIAQNEGIFCEPASAAPVAGFIKIHRADKKFFKKRSVIVCTLTGNGLKDPDIAIKLCDVPEPVESNLEEIKKLLDT